MTTTTTERPTVRTFDDAGATLVLAMIFLVAVSLVISALASWTTNNLNNTLKFRYSSSSLYAAEAATQVALRASRYTVPTNTGTGYICPGTLSPVTLNGVTVQDWCVTRTHTGVNISRAVTITACLLTSSGSSLNGRTLCGVGAGAGATTARGLLTAVVYFDDYTSGADVTKASCTDASNQSTCGASMTIHSWLAQ